SELDAAILQAASGIAALNADYHRHEKAAVACDAQLTHAAEEESRLAHKGDQLAREKRQAEEERDALDRRQEEARASIGELEIALGDRQLDADVLDLDARRQAVMAAEETVAALRARTDDQEAGIKEARGALDAIRAVVSELDVARATAEADLSHLSHTCEDAVNATLDEVVAEIDQLEREGHAIPDASVVTAEETDDESGEVRLKADATADAAGEGDRGVRLQPDLTVPD